MSTPVADREASINFAGTEGRNFAKRYTEEMFMTCQIRLMET
jgi:hypothetical protein